MGDSNDGSSSAAQRALTEDEPEQKGLIGRLFGAFSNPETNGIAVAEPAANLPVQAERPGMLNLRRMRLDDVAVPRADITAVADDIRKDELVQVFRDSGLSRLPVFSGTLDTPIGMVHLKDLALKHGFNGGGGRFNLPKLLRPLLFAPPSMPIGVLLQKMQNDRIHMALVIDEYGGVDGLVTIEDLIEQVIGEIEDEHDIEEGHLWTEEKPGCYLVEARAPLEEFEQALGTSLTEDIDDEEIDTLGGLVFLLAGHVPARGEVIRHPEGPDFEIVDADPRRIKRLRVRLKGNGNG